MRHAALILTLAALTPGARAAGADCDRECLRGFVTQYLNALTAHNPSALPVADKVKFTEDTVEMRLGDGLWKTAARLGTHRQDILDVSQGVAASQVIIEETTEKETRPVMLMLRLKVAGKKITEVETQVTRTQKGGALFAIDALQAPGPVMSSVPEKSQLMPRDAAIKVAQFYPAGLKIGSFITVDAPFAADAYRIENGARTAGAGCARAGCENPKTQKIMEHPGITTRVVMPGCSMIFCVLRFSQPARAHPAPAVRAPFSMR